MIFGETYVQSQKRNAEDYDKKKDGYWSYAWLPVTIRDGRSVWLERIYVKPREIKLYNYHIHSTAPMYMQYDLEEF